MGKHSFMINPFKLQAPPVPLDAYTKLLLHCDAAPIVDYSIVTKAVTMNSATVIATTPKFGGGCMVVNSSRLDVTSHTDFVLGTQDFTIEFWLKIASAQADLFYGKAMWSGAPAGLYIWNTDGLDLYNTQNSFVFSSGGLVVPHDSNWHHVALERWLDGATYKAAFYVDGVQGTVNTSANWNFGGGQVTVGNVIAATYDEVRYSIGIARFKASFTPPTAPYADLTQRFLFHMEGADGTNTFTDSSALAHATSVYGGAQVKTDQFKFGAASAKFVGNGGVQVDNDSDFNFGTGDFTIDFWVLGGGGGSGYEWLFITDKSATHSTANYGFEIGIGPDNTVYCWLSTTDNDKGPTHGGDVRAAGWHHVAFVRSGASVMMFTDGVKGDTTDVGAFSVRFDASFKMWIGCGWNGASPFTGYIDEVRVSKGIACWTANFTPPTAPY